MTVRTIRMTVRGHVQGVGFRWFTRTAARGLGVVGKVRNLPDGSVEIEAAAAPEVLDRFRERVRQGPAGSRVTGIEEEEMAGAPAWNRFDIER